MNIKLKVTAVNRLISEKVSLGQVYSKINPIAKSAGIRLAECTVGAGYYQWELPGNDWMPFSKLSDDAKADAASVFYDRKAVLLTALKGSELAESACSVPSDSEYIYFRQTAEGWDISLVAWAFRYPDKPNGRELETWRTKVVAEDVNIGFEWNKVRFKNFDFTLNRYPRQTGTNGWFHVGGKVPVKRQFALSLPDGRSFHLTVTEGQNDYVYDLTEYFAVDIKVNKDGNPLSAQSCAIGFGTFQEYLTTDDNGEIHLRIPLLPTPKGEVSEKQPECVVTCSHEVKAQTPVTNEQHLAYDFNFETPPLKPEPPAPEPPMPENNPEPPAPPVEKEEIVSIKILDYEGFPVVDMPVVLGTKQKGDVEVVTDENGMCSIPRSWIGSDKKIKVRFTVTPEYQKTHDIHYKKKK